MYIYTVRPNDTISSIAVQAGVPPSLIINTNFPPFPDRLAVGQDIVILIPEQIYTVKAGDTIYSAASEFGTTASALLRNNPSLAGRQLFPGETIVIRYTDNPTDSIITNGYAYTSIDDTALKRTLSYLTYITIFTYGFTPDGELVYPDDDKLIQTALQFGTQPIMHLSTLTESGVFSSSLAADILNNDTAQNNLIDNIIRNIQVKGYRGLDVDFEFLPPSDKNKYIDFVTRVTEILNSLGYISLVALAPKTSVDQPGLLYESHDYAGLGNAANLALLMTYEWGYTYGPPLAVSPIENVERVIKFGITQIPSNKILMGIPLYGYDWKIPYIQGSMAQSLSPQQALETASLNNAQIIYDEQAQAPFFYYSTNGQNHIVWFENAKSAAAKYDIIKNYSLAGAGYWNIDRFFPQNLLVLNSLFNIVRY